MNIFWMILWWKFCIKNLDKAKLWRITRQVILSYGFCMEEVLWGTERPRDSRHQSPVSLVDFATSSKTCTSGLKPPHRSSRKKNTLNTHLDCYTQKGRAYSRSYGSCLLTRHCTSTWWIGGTDWRLSLYERPFLEDVSPPCLTSKATGWYWRHQYQW